MKFTNRKILATTTALALLIPTSSVFAADDANDTLTLEEIVVTSRKREESLMDVPDSVTTFSSMTIKNSGIDEVQDFFDMTPNMTIRETFRAGVTFISMRGITTGQQGWAPVTFVVDGVQVGALDFINQGALNDIERIEVLKGPQGALYGAGAIAGAINIITKKPTNELEIGAKASFASGNDIKLSTAISGPIVEDKLYFRLNGYYRNTDGNQKTTDGVGLNFEEQATIRGRLLYEDEGLSIDVKASYSDITAGAAMQEMLPEDATLIDVFETAEVPGPERGIIGYENRTFVNFSARIEVELGEASLISTTGYNELDQDLFGSVSWQKPPAISIFGPVGGPGDAFNDSFQELADNFKVFTQDVRLTSSADQKLRWMIGSSYIWRESETFLNVGGLLTGFEKNPADMVTFFSRRDIKHDKAWGIFGQVNYDITEKMELSVAGRYDVDNYDTSQCTDMSCTAFIPVPSPDGLTMIDTQKQKDKDFQPKVQLSYDWTDEFMTYLTYAEGFRYGFFNTGNATKNESTKNFEVGFKSELADGRVRVSGALFHIDYSDQQLTSIIIDPPFRITSNIPESDINGFELEAVALVAEGLTVSGGVGYIDAEIANDGGRSPGAPKLTINLSVDYNTALTDEWDLYARVDYRHQGDFLINDGATIYTVPAKNYINARLSLRSENYTIGVFANNLFDERQANDLAGFAGIGIVRVNNTPRSIGVEASVQF